MYLYLNRFFVGGKRTNKFTMLQTQILHDIYMTDYTDF